MPKTHLYLTGLLCLSIAAWPGQAAAAGHDLEITKVQADAAFTQIAISVTDNDDKLKAQAVVSLGGNPLPVLSATIAIRSGRPTAQRSHLLPRVPTSRCCAPITSGWFQPRVEN